MSCVVQLFNDEQKICIAHNTIQSLTNQITENQTAINELRAEVSRLRSKESRLMAEVELYKTDKEDKEIKLVQCLNEIDTMVSRSPLLWVPTCSVLANPYKERFHWFQFEL